MPIVGTAGHVDHGKSTLIQALTGRNPDRLVEEQERGLTIDLGFAWAELPSGTSVGFVDVPGHERFIKNMLAGIEAVNVGLLVVAADEGWMPQSEEHLAVLDLLEIPRLVIALTRTGLADEETRQLAIAEVQEKIVGTVAADAPIIPVDSLSGEGLDSLRKALDDAIATTTVVVLGRPRLWVDRSFTISGAGTVITGTLVDGSLTTGDEVAVLPGPHVSRIRGIQSHEQALETVEPATRTALNLGGLETGAIARGAMLGRPDEWAPSSRVLVALHTVRGLVSPIKDRGAYHLHVGSGSWPARVRLLDGPELIGFGHAVITTDIPIPLAMGDRFILREVGRRAVVGGGRVLEPSPPRRIRTADVGLLDDAVATTPDEQAGALLKSRGSEQTTTLAAHTRGGVVTMAVVAGGLALDPEAADRLIVRAAEIVEEFQIANPLRPGMPKASLASVLGVELGLLDVVLGRADGLEESGSDVATSGFKVELDSQDELAWEAARTKLRAGLAVPSLGQLGLSKELVHALVRSGALIRVSPDLAYLPDQVGSMVERLGELPEGFTVAQFRDQFGLTRKYAVPILEWLDSEGHTVRRGDGRTAKSK